MARSVQVVNLTGHPLRLGLTETNNLRFRSGRRIRLDTHYREDEKVMIESEDGTVTIPILTLIPGVGHDPVPAAEDGVLYVVSGLVAARLRRPDVVSPARLYKEDGKTQMARALLRYD